MRPGKSNVHPTRRPCAKSCKPVHVRASPIGPLGSHIQSTTVPGYVPLHFLYLCTCNVPFLPALCSLTAPATPPTCIPFPFPHRSANEASQCGELSLRVTNNGCCYRHRRSRNTPTKEYVVISKPRSCLSSPHVSPHFILRYALPRCGPLIARIHFPAPRFTVVFSALSDLRRCYYTVQYTAYNTKQCGVVHYSVHPDDVVR